MGCSDLALSAALDNPRFIPIPAVPVALKVIVFSIKAWIDQYFVIKVRRCYVLNMAGLLAAVSKVTS